MKQMKKMMCLFLTVILLLPSAVYAANDAQAALNYDDAANWAYFELGEDKGVDVFLICPTVDTRSERNSLDLNDKLKANFIYALDLEKGIYEDAGRLFSPYYRQMSMNAYKLSAEERAQAQELAYRDVSASFRWYLDHENGGRGIILAGFSQGAQMCLELLKEYYGGDGAEAVSLREGLVAVYAIGWSVTEDMVQAYPQIVPAKGETDTGVVVSFDCEDGTLSDTLVIPTGTKALSINPLNWKTDGTAADKSKNLGAVMSTDAEPIPALCGAYLGARGELIVTDVTAAEYPAVIDIFPDGSYHIYDYLFFFTNLKGNVAARTAVWKETSHATREYAIAAFVTATGVRGSGGTAALSAFTDANEIGTAHVSALAAAVEKGILKGYEDRTLRPRADISRVEALVMLSRCLPELEKTSPTIAFTDVPAWAKADIDRLSAAGLVLGYGNGILGASDRLTVGQVATLTERIAQKTGAAESGLHAAIQHETPSPDWVTALPQAQDQSVKQLFVVAGLGMDKTTATVTLHERDADGQWKQVLSTPGFVGKNGLCLDRDHAEGCAQTPVGVYHFNRAFGIADDPGCAIPYVKVTDDIWWSGDQREGMRYNEMVSLKDYPDLDKENSEHIVHYEYEYQYCLNISFNEDGTPGRGSAIFLHCLGTKKPYTGGCVAVPEYSMKQIMQTVRPDCVVVIDTLENLGGSL